MRFYQVVRDDLAHARVVESPAGAARDAEARRRIDDIGNAALRLFAEHGITSTSLREVAEHADVSVGLVQYHFGTKGNLVDAVDRYAVEVLTQSLTTLADGAHSHSPALRAADFIARHPDVTNYLARALVDNTAAGARAFDALVEAGRTQWHRSVSCGHAHPGSDPGWALLNPLLAALAAVILRPHIQRREEDPFDAQDGRERWADAFDALIRATSTSVSR